jgi:hypothetical protein
MWFRVKWSLLLLLLAFYQLERALSQTKQQNDALAKFNFLWKFKKKNASILICQQKKKKKKVHETFTKRYNIQITKENNNK